MRFSNKTKQIWLSDELRLSLEAEDTVTQSVSVDGSNILPVRVKRKVELGILSRLIDRMNQELKEKGLIAYWSRFAFLFVRPRIWGHAIVKQDASQLRGVGWYLLLGDIDSVNHILYPALSFRSSLPLVAYSHSLLTTSCDIMGIQVQIDIKTQKLVEPAAISFEVPGSSEQEIFVYGKIEMKNDSIVLLPGALIQDESLRREISNTRLQTSVHLFQRSSEPTASRAIVNVDLKYPEKPPDAAIADIKANVQAEGDTEIWDEQTAFWARVPELLEEHLLVVYEGMSRNQFPIELITQSLRRVTRALLLKRLAGFWDALDASHVQSDWPPAQKRIPTHNFSNAPYSLILEEDLDYRRVDFIAGSRLVMKAYVPKEILQEEGLMLDGAILTFPIPFIGPFHSMSQQELWSRYVIPTAAYVSLVSEIEFDILRIEEWGNG